jgi:ammonia channel protein AmtB
MIRYLFITLVYFFLSSDSRAENEYVNGIIITNNDVTFHCKITKAVNASGNNGWTYGNFSFFLIQLKTMLIVVAFSFTASFLIFKFINFIFPICISDKEEEEGLDKSKHNENYVKGTLLLGTTG